MIPGHEITIKGVAWTVINAICYLIQTMFIILWKNLAPDNALEQLKNIQKEMIARMIFILDEFFSKLTMIKAMNNRIDSLYKLVEIILGYMKKLYDGTAGTVYNAGEAVYTRAGDLYTASGASLNEAATRAVDMAGNGYDLGNEALNVGTTAASGFARRLMEFASQPQSGGGNNGVVTTTTNLSAIKEILGKLEIDDKVGIQHLIELSENMNNLYVNGNVEEEKIKLSLSSIEKIREKFNELEKSIDEKAITKKVEEYVAELSSAEIDKLIEETIIIPNMIFSLFNIVVAFREKSREYIDKLEAEELKKELQELKELKLLQKGGKSKKNVNMRLKRKKSITLKRRK